MLFDVFKYSEIKKVFIVWFLEYQQELSTILISEFESNQYLNNYTPVVNKYLYDVSYNIDNSWISASRTRNYLMDDALVDYLEQNKIYRVEDLTSVSKKRKRREEEVVNSSDQYLNTILNNGIEFENRIIEELFKRFPNKVVKVIDINSKNKSKDPIYYHMTVELIKKGVPIIYQGVLHDTVTKTYGLPDLIVRADYINKIFDEEIEVNMKKLKSNKQYPYYIIDIKNSNLHLSARSDTILNYNSVKPFKGQIAIYHKILSKIQKHDTGIGFVMASKWTRKCRDNIYQCSNPFDRVGIIDFDNSDNDYYELTTKAIEWNRLIREPNNNLNCLEPNNPNLYPNMSSTNYTRFHKVKKYLAEKNHEITDVWMCGPKHRNNALTHNCSKWSDPKLNSQILGFNGKNAKIIDIILDINRSKSNNIKDLIYPQKIKYNICNWRDRNKLSFYIDFETLNTTPFVQKEWTNYEINSPNANDLIFMIGIGHSINNKWSYKCFIADDLSDGSQRKIINQLINHINDLSKKYKCDPQNVNMYHWSNFEPLVLGKSCSKYGINMPIFNWIDILKMFHEEPIIIKGALDFSLKTVGKALYELGMINTIWSETDNINNGFDAMFQAYTLYGVKGSTDFKNKMDTIKSYNHTDCKIMWDILNALNTHV